MTSTKRLNILQEKKAVVAADLFDLAKNKEVIPQLINLLWKQDLSILPILKSGKDLAEIRQDFFAYLNEKEQALFSLDTACPEEERCLVLEALSVLKRILGERNEKITKKSSLKALVRLARNEYKGNVSIDFLVEFIKLFSAFAGQAALYKNVDRLVKKFAGEKGRQAANTRSDNLDHLTTSIKTYFEKYPSGLDEQILVRREENKQRILAFFKATEEEWQDYHWQNRHVLKDLKTIKALIKLSEDEKKAIRLSEEYKIPFGITPYYLSLMDFDNNSPNDLAVRAQVIPPLAYVEKMISHQSDRKSTCDFMGEGDTSPIDLVTRRYPSIAILKPYNTCAQICVYCQRNWEIQQVLDPYALASREKLDEALDWLSKHPAIGDVLVTGGDPMVMESDKIGYILKALAKNPAVYRVRFGTRTPVVLPMRWTDKLLNLIAKYRVPGKREIAVMTHFEHSYEISQDVVTAVSKIKEKGISVYNQQVFTPMNSRRFETAKLRRDLRRIGVDPYYTFNPKGKEEMPEYRVPVARILQERKEEARLFPGLDRTDEPVFNVPRLGKNHLRAGQDHRLIMITEEGRRIYEFDSWEKNIEPQPNYHYKDVSLLDYLVSLVQRGESATDYRTLWFYY
jgi:lysine 2,3-aminomutase